MTVDSHEAVVAVLTTAPDAEVADALATRLVEERLVACANVVPGVTSVYRWDDLVRRDTEVMIVFKTTAPALGRVKARISELHPYDVPEVLVFEVVDGAASYLDWVRGEVRSDA